MENVDPQLGHLLTPGTSQAISRGALKAKNARQPATPLNPSRLCEQFSNSLKLDAQTPAPYKLAGAPTPPGGATQAAFRAARKHKATPLLAKTSAAIIPSTTVTAPAGESSDDRLSPLERLPQLVLRLVFARLSPRDLCSLSVASKACHQLVDDNETWRPHVNALRARYGVNVPAGDSDSLMALYCNIKNSERLYGARRAQQVPQATQDVLDNFTIFSSPVSPGARSTFTPSPIQAAARKGADKENVLPKMIGKVDKSHPVSPSRLIACPGCSTFTPCPRLGAEFSHCPECNHIFCGTCMRGANDHPTPTPCAAGSRPSPHSLHEVTNAGIVGTPQGPRLAVPPQVTITASQAYTTTVTISPTSLRPIVVSPVAQQNPNALSAQTALSPVVPETTAANVSPQKRKKQPSARQESARRLKRL